MKKTKYIHISTKFDILHIYNIKIKYEFIIYFIKQKNKKKYVHELIIFIYLGNMKIMGSILSSWSDSMYEMTSNPNFMNSPPKNLFMKNIWPENRDTIELNASIFFLNLKRMVLPRKQTTYRSHWAVPSTRKRSICRPTNC